MGSKDSAEGPWKDAFKFDVHAKEDTVVSHLHNYLKCVENFKSLIKFTFTGGAEEAWRTSFDVDRSNYLSHHEFQLGCHRVRNTVNALPVNRKTQVMKYLTALEDLQKLFEALDSGGNEKLSFEEFSAPGGGVLPKARWWRLTVHSNWGSGLKVQVLGPLRLTHTVITSGLQRQPTGKRQQSQAVIHRSAGAIEIDATTLMVRQLARRFHLSLALAEDVYHYYEMADTNKDGIVDKSEFEGLMLSLHGTENIEDIPASRMQFFWQQADKDGNGALTFEEFLEWFHNYFLTDLEPDGRGPEMFVKPGMQIVNNFYSSFSRNVCSLQRQRRSSNGGAENGNGANRKKATRR